MHVGKKNGKKLEKKNPKSYRKEVYAMHVGEVGYLATVRLGREDAPH